MLQDSQSRVTSMVGCGFSYYAGGNILGGYLQDFRIYKGLAKYTQNFIPASTDPDILPDTPSGVAYSSNVAPIIDGAVAFDGSGDYLTLTSGSDFQFGSGNFTIECFVYPNTLSNYDPIIDNGSIAGNNQHDWRLYFGSVGEIWFDAKVGGTDATRNGASGGVSNGVVTKKWQHIAVTRSGNTIYTFLDGVQVLSNSFSSTIDSNYTTAYIGYDVMVSGGNYYFDGFISNLHIVKGTALYTSNFTPPSAPLTAVQNTKLLCCKSNSLTGAYDVVPTSGINDGTIWSSLVSAPSGIYSSRPVTNLFNGDTADSENGDLIPAEGDRWTVTYDFGSVSTLRFYTYYPGGNTSNGTNAFEVNGSTVTPLSKTNGGWTSLPIAGGTLTSFGSKNTSLSGLNYCYVAAIEVDGTVLLDPLGVNGNTAATNFNPFTVNINTVRGQESGYCTLDPLNIGGGTLSNGNLEHTYNSSNIRVKSTISIPTTGKWYAEFVPANAGGGNCLMGVSTQELTGM
jgi:hypothetical protein